MKRIQALLFAAIALCTLAPAHAQALRPFDAKSLERIRAMHAGKPFVLAFWSTTCEPCRDDMKVFNAAHRRYPGLPIHLVAVDPPGERAAIERFLKTYDPGRVSRWAFADEFSERIRYAVDPAWRGELPRTYFFDASHRVEAKSGALDGGEVELWFGKQSGARK